MAHTELHLGKHHGQLVSLRHPACVLMLKSPESPTLAGTDVMRSLFEADMPLLVWDASGDLARAAWRIRHAAGPIAAVAWGADPGLFDPIAAPWLPAEGREAHLRLVVSHLVPGAMEPLLVDVLLALLQAPRQFGRILTGSDGTPSFSFMPQITKALAGIAARGSGLELARRLAEIGVAGALVRSVVFSPPGECSALLADFAAALSSLQWKAAVSEHGCLDPDMLCRTGATSAFLAHEDSLGAQFARLALSIMVHRIPAALTDGGAAVVINLDGRSCPVRDVHHIVAACRSLGVSVVLCAGNAATLRQAGFRSPETVYALFDAMLCLGTPDLATMDWFDDRGAAPSPLRRSRRTLERLLPVFQRDGSMLACAGLLQDGDGILLLSGKPRAPTVVQVA